MIGLPNLLLGLADIWPTQHSSHTKIFEYFCRKYYFTINKRNPLAALIQNGSFKNQHLCFTYVEIICLLWCHWLCSDVITENIQIMMSLECCVLIGWDLRVLMKSKLRGMSRLMSWQCLILFGWGADLITSLHILKSCDLHWFYKWSH